MNSPIEFRSDNAAGAAPEIMSAIAAANMGSALAYGADDWTAELATRFARCSSTPMPRSFP